MARQTMINSVNRLVPEEQVTEAVVIQQRHSLWWLGVVGATAVGVVIVLLLDDVGVLIRGAIVGGFAGAGTAAGTSYWILARTESEVLLCRSRRLWASAIEIVERWPGGTPVTRVGSTFGGEVWEIDGERYIGSKMYRQRIQRIGDLHDPL